MLKIKDLYLRARTEILKVFVKRKVKFSQVSIISMNCIGGVLYHDLNQKFLSPTINLYFLPNDFIKFIYGIDKYLSAKLEVTKGKSYPVGTLEDIKIHFMHYNSCEEAFEKWEERKLRIIKDRIFVIMVDRDGFTEDDFKLFKMIKYPKVLFTSNKNYKSKDSIYMSKFKKDDQVPDLIPGRYMYKGLKLIKKINKVYG